MTDTVKKKTAEHIGARILSWYARHQRDLPWRKSRDPYHIWVSEVMLQQTQVETVIPYYHRFLYLFPTVFALAEAPLDRVLKAWENMGYYSRARNLHTAAQRVVEELNGRIPQTTAGLMGLPGIGPYTAAAIVSMAFDQALPAVDANVTRIITRLFAIEDPHHGQTRRYVWDLAKKLMPEKGAGHLNQALMDLGATICTPKKPSCSVCPIRTFCDAHAHDLQEVLPLKKKRGPIPHYHVTAGVLADRGGRVLITRRPNQGLLGGLWKFPGGRQMSGESLTTCLRREMRQEVGVLVRVGKGMAAVKHAYTHFRITLHAFYCTHREGTPAALGCRDWRWTAVGDLKELAFSKADRRIVEALR
ncbi:MAG: A/G-specific adenine glycosylase [Thermodesulfobacteriota bacterium]|nr:A/G-specific adenine glycosylase [Thermodesulfobacteriota bacterium]